MKKYILLGLILSLFGGLAHAQDSVLQIEGATIRGNQELPTVLYLVPWQAPKVYALDKPKQSIAAIQPMEILERSRFVRMLQYHELFKQTGQRQAQNIEINPATE